MGKKSKYYQYKIVEIGFEQAKLDNFPLERGIGYMLEDSSLDDRIIELRSELLDEIYEIVYGDYLTAHQKTILMMRLVGKTQNQIAEHLGITQSAVHKAMHGNIDYKNNRKRYGGIVKKLRKICNGNEKINEILNKIDNIKNNNT
tara:strand:- start:650 stop:1084 length:435 start_codon:yes stop_codon:yes gene_type:complete